MSSLAAQPNVNDLQVAYSYYLAHLAHLGERSALKFKKRFPIYQSWLQLSSLERKEATKEGFGNESFETITANFDALMDRALADVKAHERQGIRVFSIDSVEYPELLRQIPDPPLVLFVKGLIDTVSDNFNIAVVGTRDATPTGEKVALKIAKWLGENRWCVVSGLAKGIDTAAHRGALDAHFCTAAVMATPLNKIYPVENKELASDILDHGGCWISELPLWKKTYRNAFVQRDRIQSGMSVAIVPVQTDVEGGTMHTVRYAEQQNRLVLCPRPIEGEQTVKQYAGIRNLINTRRAKPFSGDEYGHILESLAKHRDELLKRHPQERVSQIPNEPVSSLAEIPIDIQQTNAESGIKAASEPKRKKRSRLQVGFEFIDEPPTDRKGRARSRKERETHIQLLEQIRDEILGAQLPDGSNVSNIQDIKQWLEERIRTLRGQP